MPFSLLDLEKNDNEFHSPHLISTEFETPKMHVNINSAFKLNYELECGPMPNVMAALPNIGGALCSTPQSLADAQYWNAMQ